MTTSIVHISDIHISEAGNFITGRTGQISAAICEADMQCRSFVIVLSGDVASQGLEAEYALASRFLQGIKKAIEENRPGSSVQFVAVPGNHDCVLPTAEIYLRNALIEGLRPTLHTAKPDQMILNALLDRQQHYCDFAKQLFEFPLTETEKLCGSRFVHVPEGKFLFTLYNTALLSRRNEEQGIMLPIEVMRTSAEVTQECLLSIAVFHHPYYWLDPNDGIEFRNHIERTSDITLTGHQHVEHGFIKHNLSGDSLFYSEGHVLQEHGEPGRSAFRVIVLNPEREMRRVVSYQWKKSLYSPLVESDWTSFCRPRAQSVTLSPSMEFLAKLSDSGIGLTHSITGPLHLDTFFVWPDVTLRKAGSFDIARDLSGSSVFDYISGGSRIIVQGPAYAGKSALAQTLSKGWLRTRLLYPLLISGKKLKRNDASEFEAFVDAETVNAYGNESLTKFRQQPVQSKVLIVDDWDQSALDTEAENLLLVTAGSYFGKIVLFVSNISYIDYFLGKIEAKTQLVKYDLLTIRPMSFLARGQLIEKWISMELSREAPEFSRRVEEAERLLDTVIGRNTLPSLPFIVLAILEASQRNRDKIPDNGSFGYLYEILITAALSTTLGTKPQLDRKYTFLSLLAFQMFTDGLDAISVQRAKELLNNYAKDWIIKLGVC